MHLCYKSARKAPIPLSNFFLQNLAWGGTLRPAPHTKTHRYGFENVGLQPPKLVIFGINFPQMGISP